MEPDTEPVQVSILPFGSIRLSVKLSPPPELVSEGDGKAIRVIEETTALTRFLSFPPQARPLKE